MTRVVQCMRRIVQHNLTMVDNCGAQLVVADKKGSLFQLDSVANGGERRIYWLDCPEDHRQQYCHCLYCRAQIIARHFERRRVYCRPEQETRRPAGANIGPGVIKEAAFHLWCFVQLAWFSEVFFFSSLVVLGQTSLAEELERLKWKRGWSLFRCWMNTTICPPHLVFWPLTGF